MIIVRIPKNLEKRFVKSLVEKGKKNCKRGVVLGDVASSDAFVYFIVPDEALSVAFAYNVFLKAKRKNLNVEVAYAVSIDLESILPEDVKRVGSVWTSRKLSKEEIKQLKNKFITPNILEAILRR